MQQKRPVSLLSGTKNRSNLSGIEHILTNILVPKYFFKLKLRIIFWKIRKKYFGLNLKTDKDISNIPTDSSLAGQQLKDSTKLRKSVEK